MLFTSYEFIGFLALLFLLYFALPKLGPKAARWQGPLLLIGSYIFYAFANPWYLVFILVTTLTIYAAALLIQKNSDDQKAYIKAHPDLSADEKKSYREGQKTRRKRMVALALLLNLGILALVKYGNFFVGNLYSLLHAFGSTSQTPVLNLLVPMGISFYTFQSVGYLIDVYRGTVPAQRSLLKYALFVGFFPQLIQGPISRFGDLSQTLYEPHPFNGASFSRGLQRVLFGYFKKLVIADRIAVGLGGILQNYTEYSGLYYLLGMILFTVELYADFTGGIDITIGIAESLGIRIKENFIRPYFSTSLKEYWRRWHISMASWFRDYLFYPVSTSGWMKRFTKFTKNRFGQGVGKRIPVYAASFIVWFSTGIWHGASWNFIVWGLANFVVLMVSEELEPLYKRFHASKAGQAIAASRGKARAYLIFQMLRTFLLVCVMNLFDVYTHIFDTFRGFLSIFRFGSWELSATKLLATGYGGWDFLIIGLGSLLMLAVSLISRQEDGDAAMIVSGYGPDWRDKLFGKSFAVRALVVCGLLLAVLIFGIYGIGYDASQFIYNQF